MAVNKEEIANARRLLGERLKYCRATFFQELTQEALAKAAEIDRSWLINMEKGHENYTIEMLIAVVLACGLSIEEFFVGPAKAGVDQESLQHLDTILRVGDPDMQVTIKTTLQSLAETAIRNRMKHRKPPPRPEPGMEGGQAQGVGHTSVPKKKHAS